MSAKLAIMEPWRPNISTHDPDAEESQTYMYLSFPGWWKTPFDLFYILFFSYFTDILELLMLFIIYYPFPLLFLDFCFSIWFNLDIM